MAVSNSGVGNSGNSSPGQQPGGALPRGGQPQRNEGRTSSPGPLSVPSPKGQRASGDDIMSLVDGEGVAPSLAHPETETQPVKPGAQKTKAKPKTPAEARSQAAEEIQAPSDSVDLESLFSEALQDFERPAARPNDLDPALLQGEDGQPLSERETNRVQFLANRAKAAEDRAIASENRMQGMQRHFQQQFEQFQSGIGQQLLETTRQNAHLQGKLEALLGGQRREQLSPEEQLENDLVNKASTATEKKLLGHIQKLTQRLDMHDKSAQQARQQANTQRNVQQYKHEAAHHARSVVLAGFPEKDSTDLLPLAQELVLAKAYGKNTNMAAAAKMVQHDFLRLSLGFIRAKAGLEKQKRQQSEGAPNPNPAPRSHGSGEAEPSYKELRAAGFNGPLPQMDWDLAGRPALRRG